jgi:cytochrome c-type biogenesis protein
MQHQVTFTYAFIAGVLSFVSPCVLPLVPGYVSMLSGATGTADAEAPPRGISPRLLRNSLLFVFGFSIVFVALGAAATSVGSAMRAHQVLLGQIGGVIVILFGLHLMGVIRIGALYSDKRLHGSGQGFRNSGLGAFVIGFAFAFGWTPCIGPILGTIILLASQESTVGQGVLLLVIYSLGLAVPFLLTALALDRFAAFYKGFRRHLHAVEVVSGVLLVGIGLLLLTHSFTWISSTMSRVPGFNRLLL